MHVQGFAAQEFHKHEVKSLHTGTTETGDKGVRIVISLRYSLDIGDPILQQILLDEGVALGMSRKDYTVDNVVKALEKNVSPNNVSRPQPSPGSVALCHHFSPAVMPGTVFCPAATLRDEAGVDRPKRLPSYGIPTHPVSIAKAQSEERGTYLDNYTYAERHVSGDFIRLRALRGEVTKVTITNSQVCNMNQRFLGGEDSTATRSTRKVSARSRRRNRPTTAATAVGADDHVPDEIHTASYGVPDALEIHSEYVLDGKGAGSWVNSTTKTIRRLRIGDRVKTSKVRTNYHIEASDRKKPPWRCTHPLLLNCLIASRLYKWMHRDLTEKILGGFDSGDFPPRSGEDVTFRVGGSGGSPETYGMNARDIQDESNTQRVPGTSMPGNQCLSSHMNDYLLKLVQRKGIVAVFLHPTEGEKVDRKVLQYVGMFQVREAVVGRKFTAADALDYARSVPGGSGIPKKEALWTRGDGSIIAEFVYAKIDPIHHLKRKNDNQPVMPYPKEEPVIWDLKFSSEQANRRFNYEVKDQDDEGAEDSQFNTLNQLAGGSYVYEKMQEAGFLESIFEDEDHINKEVDDSIQISPSQFLQMMALLSVANSFRALQRAVIVDDKNGRKYSHYLLRTVRMTTTASRLVTTPWDVFSNVARRHLGYGPWTSQDSFKGTRPSPATPKCLDPRQSGRRSITGCPILERSSQAS
mmetsp:Transcript_15454/g.42726  ORF Transcript_15454/g.42726 Transcript_15454/m.42726 type:complete len:693 (+) Transcript_15454:825-2903(+)